MKINTLFKAIMVLITALVYAHATPVGTILPTVELSGSKGGYVTGESFTSSVLKGHINLLFYVDPDQSDDGKEINAALKEARTSGKIILDRYQVFAIINMASTWKPNWVLSSVLKGKQEKYPLSRFVKDDDRTLEATWSLSSDSYECLIIDENAKVLYHKKAPFSQADIDEAVKTVIDHTKRLSLK